jgi:hypothetical protein
MSEMADMYREFDERQKVKRQKNLKWNTDVLLWAEVEYGFRLVKHTEYHYSLYHPIKGRMDMWPSTGKISWFNKVPKVGRPHSPTVIKDIEAYLMKHFKPE